jgi:predicted transcriptional regulator
MPTILAAEAIEAYLETQAWQIHAIKKAIKKANSKDTIFIDHDKVVGWVNSWGSEEDIHQELKDFE